MCFILIFLSQLTTVYSKVPSNLFRGVGKFPLYDGNFLEEPSTREIRMIESILYLCRRNLPRVYIGMIYQSQQINKRSKSGKVGLI